MNEQNTSVNLRDLLLRRKLNLSQKSWNQINEKWHDEIYVSKQSDLFKRHRRDYPTCLWKSNKSQISLPQSFVVTEIGNVSESDTLVSKLQKEVNDLQYKIFTLSIVNIGLVVLHIIRS
jgi:hypothetical protein